LQDFTETDLEALDREITEKHADLPQYSVNNLKLDTIFALLNVSPQGAGSGNYLYITRENQGVIPIGGYDYGYKIESYQATATEVTIGNHTCTIRLDNDANMVTIDMEGDTALVFDLMPLADEIYREFRDGQLAKKPDGGNQFYYPSERMLLQRENSQF